MGSLKEIKRRISAARGTQKITHAMKLVSAARLRAAQNAALEGRAYADELTQAVVRISKRLGPGAPSLWRRPARLDALDALVITSDRGFCGSFNENLLRNVHEGARLHEEHNIKIKMLVIGKKGAQYLEEKGYDVFRINDKDGIEVAVSEASEVMGDRFVTGETSGGVVCFNRFLSTSKYEPEIWDLLPLFSRGQGEERSLEYKYEPSKEEALNFFAKRIISTTIRQAILESKVSELAARIVAMTSASKNASDMIAHLTGLYNKARQENITLELLDVVGGANALSG